MKYTLYREGSVYKGNLHLHTTVSDGEATPNEAKEIYKNKGYHFLAITDHNIYGVYEELNDKDFLIIPGIEIDSFKDNRTHHVVGIGYPDTTLFKHGYVWDKQKNIDASVQDLIDFFNENNNMAICAHPAWSYENLYEISNLENLLGMEVMNYSCEQESKRGNADVYYEQLCCKNKNVWCFGSDDAHGHVPDYCGAYVMVKAKEFTHKGILDAIKDGSFYACYINHGEKSPQILDFYVEDGVAKIFTTPCKHININGDRSYYFPSFADENKPLTYAEIKLPEGMEYVRAVCTDFNGNITWSQPIKLL